MTAALAVSISAASAIAASTDKTPTMEADPAEIGLEGTVLINELARAYKPGVAGEGEAAGEYDKLDTKLCGGILPSYQERRKYSYKRYDTKGTDNPFRCYVFKRDIPDDVARHVRAGFALSDLYCDTFFRRIAAHSTQRRFARSAVNDVGAAISAVLGLASAGAGLTGGIGAGFGLADGTFRNYDDSFLVAPDLPGLQKLVRSEQDKLRDATIGKMPVTFPDATVAIIRYANLCSFIGMKGLLNKSISDSADPTASRERMVEAIAAYQAMRDEIADTTKALNDKRKEDIAAQKAAAEKDAADRLRPNQPTDTPVTPKPIDPAGSLATPPVTEETPIS